MDGGNVHAYFFKNTPPLHHGHHAAPAHWAMPRGRAKPSGRSKGDIPLILQRFITGANLIPQLAKPRRGPLFLLRQRWGRRARKIHTKITGKAPKRDSHDYIPPNSSSQGILKCMHSIENKTKKTISI
jgi:hypothetical protein